MKFEIEVCDVTGAVVSIVVKHPDGSYNKIDPRDVPYARDAVFRLADVIRTLRKNNPHWKPS